VGFVGRNLHIECCRQACNYWVNRIGGIGNLVGYGSRKFLCICLSRKKYDRGTNEEQGNDNVAFHKYVLDFGLFFFEELNGYLGFKLLLEAIVKLF
jgi:hypothetical protein